jgi:hypothetical protein
VSLDESIQKTLAVPFKFQAEIKIEVPVFQVPEGVPEAGWSMMHCAKYILLITTTIFYFQRE